ncbi:MAG: ABC transporter permease [Alphaproteobacteria bacterium]|nr:ABC transporter permease [Alphaproteobacteria bacterium]
MSAYVLRRLLATIPVMAVVALFVFLLLHLTPGDPAAVIAGDEASPAEIEGVRRKLGLDRPIWEQFLIYVGNLMRGDLGTSIFSNLPVTTLVQQRLEPTLVLAVSTLIVAVVFAVPLGVVAAWKARSAVDRIVMGISVIGFAVPVFLIGYLLVYVFAIQLRWLPIQGYSPLAGGIDKTLRSIALPSIALGLVYMALIARITRASMLEVLSEDYIRTARAKGVATTGLLLRHALKNAAVPIVTVIGIGLTLLISGVVITETVFNIAGLGRLTVDAILKRDYPIIQGLIILFAGTKVLVNLLIDLSYTFFDPRIRY